MARIRREHDAECQKARDVSTALTLTSSRSGNQLLTPSGADTAIHGLDCITGASTNLSVPDVLLREGTLT